MDSIDAKKKERKNDREHQKKMKRALDNCAVEKDITTGDGTKSLSMDGMKSVKDGISEMPSATIAASKKGKKHKEKNEKDRTRKDPSENAVNVEDEITDENDSGMGSKDGKQSLSREGGKVAEDNSGDILSFMVAAGEKRKQSKEKDETGCNLTAKVPSKNLGDVEVKMDAKKDLTRSLDDVEQAFHIGGRKAPPDAISEMPSRATVKTKKRKKSSECDKKDSRRSSEDGKQSSHIEGRKATSDDISEMPTSARITANKKIKKSKENGEKDSSRSSGDGKQSFQIECRKTTPVDISEMPFSATMTTRKKRKKNKENGEKQDNQTTIGSFKSALNVEDKMTRRSIQAAEPKGNKGASSMKKRKGTDGSEISNPKKKLKSSKDDCATSSLQKNKKKVSFSDEVGVFIVGTETDNVENVEEPLVQGKRFTIEEDNMIREAIDKYIETHQLGEEGLHMVLHAKKYRQVRHCWKEIGACLPYRPYTSVYYRAHSLLERSELRKWEPEECEIVRRFHAVHGADWKTLAGQLHKHRFHIKDCWRRIKFTNKNIGHWSQDEYQTLFDLVNQDLRLKSSEVINTKYGMIKDNIAWEAIGEKLSTRMSSACCVKWYKQLASPLVAEGVWADIDDYRLLAALQNVDACCVEDVDWDSLLEHRSGEVCKTRWGQMIRHIGGFKERSFIEKVEVLSKRYSVDMIEYRETMDALKEEKNLKEQNK